MLALALLLLSLQSYGDGLLSSKNKKLSSPQNVQLGRFAQDTNFPKLIWWSPVRGAKEYMIEVFSWEDKKKVFTGKTSKNFLDFSQQGVWRFWQLQGPKEVSYYFIRVAAIGQKEQVGKYSACQWTYVGEREFIESPPSAKDFNICAGRLPAAQVVSTQIEKKPQLLGKNKTYDRSQVQIEGASFLISTSDLQDNSGEFATAMLTTLRGYYWLNHRHGFEASFKSKVSDYNDLASEVSPTQLEARYHMRWKIPFFWKALFPEFQYSLFAGYESYKNSSSSNTNFTTSYSLMKGGMSFKFPVLESWDTGGEFVYGTGSGGNAKIEMQGYVNYYFMKKWSLGMGYRIHLLRVESEELLPVGSSLPFRETYGEAFGNLRYSF